MPTSQTLSSLPLPSVSSSQSLLTLDVEDLLERITHIKALIKDQESILAAHLDALDQLVENGEADPDLTWNDWHIYRQAGRKTYLYPQSIKDQEADLKQSKELAIALGDATVKVGQPFWTMKFEG